MKGLILAAGKGTRMAKYTDANIPKEMLPIGWTPVIGHTIELLKNAGVDDIYIVIGRGKGSVVDYLGNGQEFGVHIAYVFQDESGGWGLTKAIQSAEHYLKDEPFFPVIYGDTFLDPKRFGKELIEFHQKNRSKATLALSKVSDPTRYGIVKLGSDGRILDLVEKPTIKEAKKFETNGKYLAIAGMTVYSKEFFKYARKTKPGAKGEYQATDTVRLMLEDGLPVFGLRMGNLFYRDVGTPESYMEANQYYLNRK